MDPDQLKSYVITPCLAEVDMFSKSAVNLLAGTAAAESDLGQFVKQKGGGGALGIYQMEPATYRSIIYDYLYREEKKELSQKILSFLHYRDYPDCNELVYNLKLSTIFARLRYWYVPEPLPEDDDVRGLAYYWKKYYNTHKGKGKEIDFIQKYNQYVMHY